MGDINGMKMMIFFAILGFIMERFNFAVAPMILGLVLGPIIEPSLRRALMIHEYQFFEVLMRPITVGLLILSIVVTVTPIIWQMKRAKAARLAQHT
jgi:putative tricarboxylic transport membrane protein